jgi:hypothetical protein
MSAHSVIGFCERNRGDLDRCATVHDRLSAAFGLEGPANGRYWMYCDRSATGWPALERKRAEQAEVNAARGGKDAGKVQGAHGPAGSRRSFRRKTGG